MNPKAKLSDLIEPLEFELEDYVTRFDRRTGRIVSVERHIVSAFEEGQEEELGDIPDWQKEQLDIARSMAEDDGQRFIAAPDKFEFHEYRHMERFIGTVDDADHAEQLSRAIQGKGAFGYFKDTAHRLDLIEQWYRYRDNAMREFVIEWAKANDVPYEDDLKGRKQ
jgi:soluble cytochrome b562